VRLPPQDLICPDPAGCPVVTELPDVPAVWLAAGTPQYRVYATKRGYDEFNPGLGDTRFAPFDAVATGVRVPAMYTAGDQIGALLETVFHEVHHQADRHIYEKDLREHGLAHVLVPRRLWLADLRDAVLQDIGVGRDQLVSTPSEHYPCTRRVAHELHGRVIDGLPVAGLMWHSRQAELLDAAEPVEVCVLFGDATGTDRGSWELTGPGVRNLYEGPGRLLVDALANELGATVQPAD
jgi:hypothetical protein